MKRIITLLIAIVGALSALMAANTQLFLVGGFSGWDFLPENELSTTDGDYYVATYPTGSEIELSGEFKLADPTWKILNYGGAPSVEAGKSYTLVKNAGNISAVGKIKITKIEFTVSTATLKIIGTTSANLFDLSKDQGVSLVEKSTNVEKFVSKLTFKGNGVYTGTYTVPSGDFGLKVGGDGNFNTIDFGWNGNYIVLGEPYILKKGEMLFAAVYPEEGDWKAGDVFDVQVTFTADWTATLLLTKSTVTPTPEPETPAYVVRGNGGSDATGIWCGGIEWTGADSPVNNMTDTDADGIYEVTYKNVPAGAWNFKVVGATEGWMGSDYLDTKNSSAGYTTAPYDGNIGFSLNAPADVTIQFNTLTGKIIVTTPSGNFGKVKIDYFSVANTDECLVENRFTAANNNTLKYTENIQILEGNEYGYAGYRILGNCNYAVYEKNLLVEVTEAGIYDITIVFNGDYENPDFTITAVKQTPVGPDPEPVVTITDLKVNSFSQIEAGKTTTTTATYTITNAANATATISGTHAAYFKIISQSVNGTNGSVQIQFAPTTEGKYNAKLTITSGTATASVAISGIALAPEEEVTITNLQIGKFSNTEAGSTSTATATYTLTGATSATATLSGSDAAYFKILSQSVSKGNGTVVVEFTPNVARKYNATLNITAGGVSESVTFSAMGILPQLPAEINDLKVSSFAITNLGLSTTSTATYKLVNATSATATISGTDAKYFKILSQNVSNGNGTVQIEFTPTQARKYNATLTIAAGSASESVAFSAIGQEPVIIISNLQTPKFTVTEEDKTSVATVTYDLEGATSATATLSGADAIYFKIVSQSVSGGRGTVEIEFAPNIARKYNATLTITAGKESESVSFNAIAADAPVAPAIKNLKIEEFDIVRANESSTSLITYQLENASLKNISISGTDSDYFTLKSSGSDYSIVFTPVAAGVYVATLTITATNGLSASLDFAAACESETYSPVLDPVVTISNLKVPAFEDTQVGKTSFITATFKVQGTTCATASLSGTNATSFKIMSQSVTDGNGEVKIKFVPSKEGVYNATLTVSAGNENVITNITAKTTTAQPDPEPGPGDDPSDDPDPEPGPGDDPSDDPDPEPEPGDDPSDDPDPEPGPGDDPSDDPDPEPEPDPYPAYPVLGYLYIVDCEGDRYDEIAEYEPISNSDIDYFLVPEKLEQTIYGLDIYKFEVRNPEGIRVWNKSGVLNNSFGGWYTFDEYEGVDISKTPCYANEVWYESIEDMATWYVAYDFYKADIVSEQMQEYSPGVFVATVNSIENGHFYDGYYFYLGTVEDPIMEVGLGKYGNFIGENDLQIPQGMKVNIYLDVTNWETEYKFYHELQPIGDPWDKGYIDLGLTSGLCWATTNLGATEPEGEGLHFAWGEIEPKDNYSYNTYKWANLLEDNEYIKYVTKDRYGFVDFRNTLDPSDDAANEALTSKWHIPTLQDAEELLRECTLERLEYKGVEGYYIKGPNGNVIFLPAVGQKVGEDYEECTNCGKYWTSTLHEDYQDMANVLFFNGSWSLRVDKNDRVEGLPIRPVIHRDYVGVDEVEADAIEVYAKDGTIYSELDFEIYNLTGINVTHLNGSLEGIYIVKTNEGNRLISVW